MSSPELLSHWDWAHLRETLDSQGYALTPKALTAAECLKLQELYGVEGAFRKRIVMEKHAYGSGEYVEQIRQRVYPPLAELANEWNEKLRIVQRYPKRLSEYLELCHSGGQNKPTPLILKYGTGGFNCLHRDLYGELVFPFQLTISLTRRGEDYTGGEFLLLEQRYRRQPRGEVIPLEQGQGVIFPVNHRPVLGKRGFSRASLRHGVSRIRSGRRFTLGIIFHDAE
jgi:hypothetical protein